MKHKSVEEVIMVDIDKVIVSTCAIIECGSEYKYGMVGHSLVISSAVPSTDTHSLLHT